MLFFSVLCAASASLCTFPVVCATACVPVAAFAVAFAAAFAPAAASAAAFGPPTVEKPHLWLLFVLLLLLLLFLLGRRHVEPPPLPLLTFQNVNNNFTIDETPFDLRKSQKLFLVSPRKPLVCQKKTLVSQQQNRFGVLYPPKKNFCIRKKHIPNGKSDVPVKAAWRLAKSVRKLKEKNKAAFSSPSENWCLPAPSNLKPAEREFVVDSGASMHMISKKDLSNAEMDTLTKSCSPTIVITANGEVQTHEEATVYVRELDSFLTMKVLKDTPAVLSLGKLCDEHGYSHAWINGQKPHLIKNGIRIQCNTENFVPIAVPGLSTSSSSKLLSSTSMTPTRQEIHPTFSSSSSTSPSMTTSTVSSESVDRQEWGDPCGIDHHPAMVSSERVERQER